MGEDKNLIAMFDSLIAQEDEAKEIKSGINETLQTYADNHQMPVKAVKGVFRKYKEYRKNPTDFVLIDFEEDKMLSLVIPAYTEGSKEAAA